MADRWAYNTNLVVASQPLYYLLLAVSSAILYSYYICMIHYRQYVSKYVIDVAELKFFSLL